MGCKYCTEYFHTHGLNNSRNVESMCCLLEKQVWQRIRYIKEIHQGGIIEFDSPPVVSLLVLRVSELTVQVAQMPLKVLASVAFGKK